MILLGKRGAPAFADNWTAGNILRQNTRSIKHRAYPGPQSIVSDTLPKLRNNYICKESRMWQLSLKYSMSSGQRHLVPAAPEASQILRMTTAHFQSPETQHNADERPCLLRVVALALSETFAQDG